MKKIKVGEYNEESSLHLLNETLNEIDELFVRTKRDLLKLSVFEEDMSSSLAIGPLKTARLKQMSDLIKMKLEANKMINQRLATKEIGSSVSVETDFDTLSVLDQIEKGRRK